MAWSTSNRSSRLPPHWKTKIVPDILARDKHTCQLKIPGKCIVKATEVDHISPGDDHSYKNLRAVCTRCHAHKSAVEGRQAQLRRKALGKRPPERHPGLSDEGYKGPSGDRPVDPTARAT